MTDKQWMKEVRKIKDPKAMLQKILDSWDMLATDSYYEELTSCLFDQATKILEERNGII